MIAKFRRGLAFNVAALGGGYTFVNTEASTYVAAMPVQPTIAIKAAIDVLFTALKAGALSGTNLLTKLDFLYLLALHDPSAALINAVNPGTFTPAIVGDVSFSAGNGFTGNGTTGYLRTNYNPGGASLKYVQNSAHMAVWSNTNAAENTFDIGARVGVSTSQATMAIRLGTGNTIAHRVNVDASPTNSGTNVNSIGHHVARRSASNAGAGIRNAISLGTYANASVTIPNLEWYIGALNNNGTAASFTNRQYKAAHAGSALTDNEITDLYCALNYFLFSVGAGDFAEVTVSATTLQNLPDAQGGDVGEGFTSTGLAKAPAELAFWIANDGRDVGGDTSYEPSLVKTGLDGSTKLDEIDLTSVYPSMESIQGLDIEESDGSFWIASLNEGKVRHLSSAGVDLGDGFDFADVNGLAIDTNRNKLLLTSATNIYRVNFDGSGSVLLVSGVPDLDQLYYSSSLDWFFATYGLNGVAGRVNAYDASTGALKRTFELNEARSIEGVWVDAVAKKIYVTHDGYFHNEGNLKNQLQIYDLPSWILP